VSKRPAFIPPQAPANSAISLAQEAAADPNLTAEGAAIAVLRLAIHHSAESGKPITDPGGLIKGVADLVAAAGPGKDGFREALASVLGQNE
jgi:hypothetical protein